MTTIISTSYDALITVIQNVLTDWTRLFNADQLADNFDSALRKGWCLQVESGNDTNRHLCKISDWERSFTLFLVTEFFGSNFDHSNQDNAIKTIMEAVSSIAIAIESDPYLAISGGNAICSIVNDTGIFPLETESRKFIGCGVNLTIKTYLGY